MIALVPSNVPVKYSCLLNNGTKLFSIMYLVSYAFKTVLLTNESFQIDIVLYGKGMATVISI